jgi:ribosomal protein S18 acetylase RimI-like enzyme
MVMQVTLEPMTPEEIGPWQERLWIEYRSDMIKAGSTAAAADANIERNREALMPGGELAEGQHVLTVTDGANPIGCLWLAQRAPGEWFVYDIEIDPEHRGRGFGRATMLAAEDYVTARGGIKLGLSVFGFNEVAHSLYRSLGYSVLAMNMSKSLT